MTMDGPPASGSMPQLEPPSLVGQVLDGRYRLVKKLGEGGMGEVYAADHIHIEKRFAVKLLRPEIVSNREAVQRFRQEARSSSSIGHRNIIAIEDFGDLPDGRIYMCMELLNGAPLNDMIRQPMPVDRLLNILIQTGHGLAAAHAKGIIHRDMKPENIFVTVGPSGEDVPKLLDFGIAKVSGNDGQNNLTKTGTIFGTPFYMAPEQALGNPVDARTDIYAVGVIMYEVFSGSLPFQGESFMGILTQHITTEPEPVAQRAAKAGRQLPQGLAEVITRCVQKNPAQRYQTMDDLVSGLVQIYRGISGPGMSAYMEAFPISSVHPVPTPGPMTGPVRVGPTSSTQGAVSGPKGSPSGPYHPATGPTPAYYADSAPVPQKKSKTGLIIAIIALLAIGGGVAAFVIVSQGDDKTKDKPKDDHIVTNDKPDAAVQASAKDAAVVVTNPPDATVATTNPPDAHDVWDGKDGGSTVTPPDAGTVVTPSSIPVLLMAKNGVGFEVYEGGKKQFDGPDNLDVTPGTPRTIVIKSRGFKDKTIIVDVKDGMATCSGSGCAGDKKKKKVTFSLDRASVIIHDGSNGSGHTPPPPRMDCREQLKDPHDKECRAQYCARHEDDVRCGLE